MRPCHSGAVITTVVWGVLVAGCAAPVVPPAPSVVATNIAAPPPAAPGQPSASTFSQAQIDQMMAPIALYPDSLLSQVLMASTYPADVADAAKWSRANPGQKGDAAVQAADAQPWDPSVKSLLAFPQVIQTMGDKPDWVQNLGDAFLASSKDVLDSAQRLRNRAQATGSLKSSEQQTVSLGQGAEGAITIEPANPQVVYVPAYDPAIVYGTWPYPAYPPYYYPPAALYYPGAALATGIAFGVGVAVTAALWGNCNWGGGNVNINVNRFNSINSNRQLAANQNAFQHNATNRRGVPYRDSRSQQQYGRNVPGADQRGDFRGREAQRPQAQPTGQQRGFDGGPARNENAFRGAGDTGQMQQQFNRDSANRQAPARQPGAANPGARYGGSSAAYRGSAGGGARMGGGGRGGGGRGGGRR